MRTASEHPESLTPHDLRRVAVEAGVDPRTVQRYLDGARLVSTCIDRIRRALAALGMPDARRQRQGAA